MKLLDVLVFILTNTILAKEATRVGRRTSVKGSYTLPNHERRKLKKGSDPKWKSIFSTVRDSIVSLSVSPSVSSPAWANSTMSPSFAPSPTNNGTSSSPPSFSPVQLDSKAEQIAVTKLLKKGVVKSQMHKLDDNLPKSGKESKIGKTMGKGSDKNTDDSYGKGKGKGGSMTTDDGYGTDDASNDDYSAGKGKGMGSVTDDGFGKGKGKGGGKGTGKGKGKGKGSNSISPSPTPMLMCQSALANSIRSAVPEATTRNPNRCCAYTGPSAVFVTHAKSDDTTISGFEPFWDAFYQQISMTTEEVNICFVMTGIDQTKGNTRTLTESLIALVDFVSKLPQVPALMTTDPTDQVSLIGEVRAIYSDPLKSSIGVFNSGYNNIIIESIVSGQDRLPYIGVLDDTDYGKVAANATRNLLGDATPQPLCFNGRPDLTFLGERCATYYTSLGDTTASPTTGVVCNATTTAEEILPLLSSSTVNAVWTHVDCCTAVAKAAKLAQNLGKSIIVGCQDQNTSPGNVNFVTQQPIALQSFSATSWVSLPVITSQQGADGRGRQYFPSLQSLINTAVYNQIFL